MGKVTIHWGSPIQAHPRSVAFCSLAKFKFWWFNGKPISWQKVRQLGKMHQRGYARDPPQESQEMTIGNRRHFGRRTPLNRPKLSLDDVNLALRTSSKTHMGRTSAGSASGEPSPTWMVFTSGNRRPLTPNTHFLLGYHGDPLLKKEVFTMETQVFQKKRETPLKK